MRKLLLMLTALLTIAACENDVYEKGDNTYSYMRADFVEAIVGHDKNVGYVMTDDDMRMELTKPYNASWIQRADTVYRAVMFYNLTGEKAEVVSLSRLSTVAVRKSQSYAKGVKTDPVKLESVWLSTNKRYLNLSVILKTGALEEGVAPQSLGMVGDTIITGKDNVRTCYLRLYHNQGQVPQYYSQRIYFSIPLSGLQADSLQLRINTYNGVVTKAFHL